MPIPPGYASVSVERICQPDFEELEIDIPRDDREKTLKDALHGIILWPERYIVIILENDGSLRDHLERGQPSSPGPSSTLPTLSPSPQQPYDNSGEQSSSDYNDDIPPNSPQQPFATSSQAQSFRSVQPPKKKRKRSAKKKPEAKTDEKSERKKKTGRAGGHKK
jgi:hypothetical protein